MSQFRRRIVQVEQNIYSWCVLLHHSYSLDRSLGPVAIRAFFFKKKKSSAEDAFSLSEK